MKSSLLTIDTTCKTNTHRLYVYIFLCCKQTIYASATSTRKSDPLSPAFLLFASVLSCIYSVSSSVHLCLILYHVVWLTQRVISEQWASLVKQVHATCSHMHMSRQVECHSYVSMHTLGCRCVKTCKSNKNSGATWNQSFELTTPHEVFIPNMKKWREGEGLTSL